MMSGDVEPNPQPNTRTQAHSPLTDSRSKQLDDVFAMLQAVNTRTKKMDKDQAELIKSVEDLKKVQADFQENLSNMDKGLAEVECKTVALEEITDEVQCLRQNINELHSENAPLCAKQGQLEDMQRRDNLLFLRLT
ncbi:hypothetical protein HPB50_003657 [Hyalomma asiaticum]|uniref:Uncharacterized protein n=1 Tax=Hyalomma asiaticum TaxID=266040 RepID=A0ACB7TAH7_HYAAI|nr:hypothetical protein HPB50_003657 [Hyalomma asiaticum]